MGRNGFSLWCVWLQDDTTLDGHKNKKKRRKKNQMELADAFM